MDGKISIFSVAKKYGLGVRNLLGKNIWWRVGGIVAKSVFASGSLFFEAEFS